jgi:hypothetical protein
LWSKTADPNIKKKEVVGRVGGENEELLKILQDLPSSTSSFTKPSETIGLIGPTTGLIANSEIKK